MDAETFFMTATIGKKHFNEWIVELSNKTGMFHQLLGSSDENSADHLYFIPKSGTGKEELLKYFTSLPYIHKISILPVSYPVQDDTLIGIRRLFLNAGWDSSQASNEDIRLYINDVLQGKHGYYIDPIDEPVRLPKMRICKIEEHPDYEEIWLKKKEQNPQEEDENKIYTLEDFTQEAISFEESIDDDQDIPEFPEDKK